MNYTDAERRGIMAQLPARLATAGTKSQIKMRLSELPERPL